MLALLATNLAMVVPSSAASIGVFEVAAKASLTAYGVPAALALSFALVLHAVNILPDASARRDRARAGRVCPVASSCSGPADETAVP